jgi:hypothetical protein
MNSIILEFFIFNRSGVCLLHLDLQEEQIVVTNKVINCDKKSEDRYKLIFGLLFSMKSFVKNLSPKKPEDILKTFSTNSYKLHYLELLNGLRFVAISKPIKTDLTNMLKDIYSAFYVNFISKNIFIKKDDLIKSDIFMELVYNYLINITI